jgi:hypothetical protein
MANIFRMGFIASVVGLLAAPAAFAQPVVAELFTSQGCSSCPPANQVLADLGDRPEIIALSFSVTYWDKLGWKDTLARPAYTQRQKDYAPRLGNESIFTPQIVVNGRADAIGSHKREVEALVAEARGKTDSPMLTVAANQVAIGAGKVPPSPADIWLVRYDPRVIQVPVGRGENGGRTLPHRNVVRELVQIGQWNGAATVVALPPPSALGLRTAVLVQTPHGGPILAAGETPHTR